MQDLGRRSGGKIHFLERRMYENYLLNPDALAAVTTELDGFSDSPLPSSRFREWLEEHGWDADYFEETIPEEKRTKEVWLAKVNGARLLKNMFNELSENRYPYFKTECGVLLTEWLIRHSPDDLQEVKELLNRVLDAHSERRD
jgi:hypothetical protein